ncbi:MAG: GTP 3',8-cyclase MoaA [Gammaproteobacteria bacterium]|nr:GTP 3',8-cyclase MoaA [Gammaproteobacteria bacterium]
MGNDELESSNCSAQLESIDGSVAPLQDRFGRTFDYVRIAIIEKCNLRCTYCMPEEGVEFADKNMILNTDELLRTIRVLARLGIKKIRYTGGEPLMRKDILDLVRGANNTPGIKGVHLTTNGLLFPRLAKKLLDAGLMGVNISLDTLDPGKFKEITRRDGIEEVLESINLAVKLGFPRVKINVVLMRGFNENEIAAFTELTKDLPVTVRFIEFMPFDADQIWESGDHFASAQNIVDQIKSLYPGLEVAPGTRTEHYIFKAPGYAGKIAVIPAFTRNLCGNCSRIRLTADGAVRNCLYSDKDYDLRSLMREGCSDDEIITLFRYAYGEKAKDGFEAKKLSDQKIVNLDGLRQLRTSMTQIGG